MIFTGTAILCITASEGGHPRSAVQPEEPVTTLKTTIPSGPGYDRGAHFRRRACRAAHSRQEKTIHG
jgi:hypothetical protein